MRIKLLLFSILTLVIITLAAYIFQNPKIGAGSDATIRYQLIDNWIHLPRNIKLGNPVGLGIDHEQNLIIFHRAGREWPLIGELSTSLIPDNTILVVNTTTGEIVTQWGANLFAMPHGLSIDKEDNIWVTDVALHQVFKFDPQGKLLLTLGARGESGSDSAHFDQPTDVAVDQSGSVYVSDGYGNSRVMKFSSQGKFVFEFGRRGEGPGEFNIPHGLAIDDQNRLYVADRENCRIQIFDTAGIFIKEIKDKSFGNFCGLYFARLASKIFAVDDHSFLKLRHRGSDIFIFDPSGGVQSRFGRSGTMDLARGWYHDVAVDNNHSIYVGDILNSRVLKFKKE